MELHRVFLGRIVVIRDIHPSGIRLYFHRKLYVFVALVGTVLESGKAYNGAALVNGNSIDVVQTERIKRVRIYYVPLAAIEIVLQGLAAELGSGIEACGVPVHVANPLGTGKRVPMSRSNF